jgi:hypothetical protein
MVDAEVAAIGLMESAAIRTLDLEEETGSEPGMATAELAPTTATPSPAIRNPLERLRSTIRRYVLLEGLAVCGIVLALWFWLGLLFDFGVFKSFHFDWVQEAPRSLRAIVLIGVVALLLGILIVKVIRRLMVEFSAPALALVLERRFPQQLGDRLITAVELADLKRAEEQGYSRELIRQTAEEAEARLQSVPIHDVFDWSRLRRLTGWLIALTFGVFLLVGIAYSAITRTNPLTDFLVRFRDVSAIWFERNVLLWNTIWPRNVYLELVDFPASGDLRVGRDNPAVRLKVRSIKWLIADRNAPEGWRAMTWADVTPDLLGGPLPAIAQPPSNSATLDDLNRTSDRSVGSADEPALKSMFQQLAERAALPGMGRTLRLLEIPNRVEIVTWGAKTSNETPIPLGTNQEYSGTLNDLKESVRFRVRAGDYSTSAQSITLVPPPMLTSLVRNDLRPAYIYHRPPVDGGAPALRGLQQKITDQAISLSDPTSHIGVPAGTDLELVGTLDKELTGAALIPAARKGEPGNAAVPLELSPDRHGFRHSFANVQSPIDFELEFTDTDHVRSRRHVLIEPAKDAEPAVNVILDGIRKTNAGYMVTPVAMIPIAGTIADSYGIQSAEYDLSVVRLESAAVLGAHAAAAAGASMQFSPIDPATMFSGVVALHEANRLLTTGSQTPRPYRFPLRSFEELAKDRAARDLILSELTKRLNDPPSDSRHILQFEVKPQFEFLDLRDRLPDLKVKEEQALQPRYRLKLTVNATDFNVESGPGVGVNKEPPFTVLVVSEPELLVEIANDERHQHFKMEEAISKLKDARLRLDKVAEELPMIDPGKIATMALRAQEIQDTILKARDTSQEVLNEYSRLLREMELNRVMPKLVEKVKGEIIMPLEGALRLEFVQAEETGDKFHQELEASRKPPADPLKLALDKLIERLSRVMDAMGEIKGINDLITALRNIEKGQEQDIGAVLRKIKKEKEEELLRKLGEVK